MAIAVICHRRGLLVKAIMPITVLQAGRAVMAHPRTPGSSRGRWMHE